MNISKMREDNYKSAKFYRGILFVASLLYLVFGEFYFCFPNIQDPMSFDQRLLGSSLFLSGFLLSFFNKWIKQKLGQVTYIVTYLAVAHLIFLNYKMAYEFSLAVSLIVVIAIVNLFFKGNFLVLYSNFVLAFTVFITILLVEKSVGFRIRYYSSYIMVAGLTSFISYRRLKTKNEIKQIKQKLKEKKQKLNEQLEYHQKYEKLFNNINSGVAVYESLNNGENFVFVDINKKGQKMDNLNKEKILAKRVTEVFPAVKEFGLFEVLQRVHKTEEPEKYPVKKYEDNRITAYRKNYVYKLSTGEIVAVYDDVTDKKKQEKKLKETKNRLELAIEGANLGLWDWDANSGQVKFNENWATMLGYELDELEKNIKAWKKRIHKKDKQRTLKKLHKHLQGDTSYYESEHRLKTKDNSWKWIKDIGRVVKRNENGAPSRVVGIHLDIDDRKRAEQKVRYLSFHDELTGLYNRRYFENEKSRLNNSRRLPISIIVGDMDKLKYINDNYGHKKGDKYIKEIANVFNEVTREEDVVARIGGDEFSVLLPETDADSAEKICTRFYNKLSKVNASNRLLNRLSISLGYATMVDSGQDLNEVFEQADNKMYANKQSKR